ncbi:hypothetical protein V9T40_003071 [Parthenolecanium corni]|uniref:Uncharacterized protein n=1 Tax=Parthenolecanium corni TaxID=536013 RepID=A0AAN9TSG7_9HEMI
MLIAGSERVELIVSPPSEEYYSRFSLKEFLTKFSISNLMMSEDRRAAVAFAAPINRGQGNFHIGRRQAVTLWLAGAAYLYASMHHHTTFSSA